MLHSNMLQVSRSVTNGSAVVCMLHRLSRCIAAAQAELRLNGHYTGCGTRWDGFSMADLLHLLLRLDWEICVGLNTHMARRSYAQQPTSRLTVLA